MCTFDSFTCLGGGLKRAEFEIEDKKFAFGND